jgi:integrase
MYARWSTPLPFPTKEIDPLTREEARAILDTTGRRRNCARWSVALALGLRQGEALGLLWSDIDLDRRSLTIRQALQRQPARHGCNSSCGRKRTADCPQRQGGGRTLVEPKSRNSRRTIALPPQLTDALRRHKAAQKTDQLRAGTEWIDTGLVFTARTEQPSTPRATTRPGRSSFRRLGSGTLGSTMPDTQPPPPCSRRSAARGPSTGNATPPDRRHDRLTGPDPCPHDPRNPGEAGPDRQVAHARAALPLQRGQSASPADAQPVTTVD